MKTKTQNSRKGTLKKKNQQKRENMSGKSICSSCQKEGKTECHRISRERD